MWPFKPKLKEQPKLAQVKEIRFGHTDGMWRYNPAKDITPYETALLIPMFIHPFWRADYQRYIDENNLRRHFTKVEE